MPKFKKFMKFNGLDEEHVSQASNYLKHKRLLKGNYLFREGEINRQFYGVIKGRISIRFRKEDSTISNEISKFTEPLEKNNLEWKDFKFSHKIDKPNKRVQININESKFNSKKRKENSSSSHNRNSENELQKQTLSDKLLFENEQEVMEFTSGMCFGEWALIYDIPRTASAFAVEDTDLFYLEKECFDCVLSKGILKSDIEKKAFILKRIPSLNFSGGVHEILKKIIPVFCDNKKIIYTELDTADYIYIIFQGECKLTISKIDGKPKNKEYIMKHQDKLITFSRVEKGGVIGLELLRSSKFYEFNLICSRDETILYKIGVSTLRMCGKDFDNYLEPILKAQENNLKMFKEKYETINHKFRFTRNLNKSNNFKNGDNIKNNKLEDENLEKINNLIEDTKKITRTPKNNLNMTKIKVIQKGSWKTLKFSQNKNEKQTISRNSNLKDDGKYTTGLKTVYNPNPVTLFEQMRKKSNLCDTLSNEALETKNEEKYYNNGLKDENKIKLIENAVTDSKLEDSESPVGLTHTLIEKSRLIPISLKKNIDSKILNSKMGCNKNLANKFVAYKPNTQIQFNTSIRSSNQKVYLKKSIENTLSVWGKDSFLKYNSGLFSLPLITTQSNYK